MKPLDLCNENLDWLSDWLNSEVEDALEGLEVVELALGEEGL